MILSLQEDGVLYVYRDIDDLILAIEPLDAEATFRMTYDDLARPYVIEWIKPNKTFGCLFGFLKTVENGEYRLVPSGGPDPVGLRRCISEAKDIDPEDKRAIVLEMANRHSIASS